MWPVSAPQEEMSVFSCPGSGGERGGGEEYRRLDSKNPLPLEDSLFHLGI